MIQEVNKETNYSVRHETKYKMIVDIQHDTQGDLYADAILSADVTVKILDQNGVEIKTFTKSFVIREGIDEVNISEDLFKLREKVSRYVEDIKVNMMKLNALIKEFNERSQ